MSNFINEVTEIAKLLDQRWQKIKTASIYIWHVVVDVTKRLYRSAKEFIRQYPKAAISIGTGLLILILLIVGAAYERRIIEFINAPRPARITSAPTNTGFQYQAQENKFNVTTYIGSNKNNNPDIKAQFKSGSSVDFTLAEVNQNISKPTQSGNTITFSNVRNGVDLKYQTIIGGLKESLVVKSPAKGNSFTFVVNTKNAAPKQIAPNLYSSTFYDNSGNFLFDFEKPFAVDAKGARSDNVLLAIIKGQTSNNLYEVRVILNDKWLAAPVLEEPPPPEPPFKPGQYVAEFA